MKRIIFLSFFCSLSFIKLYSNDIISINKTEAWTIVKYNLSEGYKIDYNGNVNFSFNEL